MNVYLPQRASFKAEFPANHNMKKGVRYAPTEFGASVLPYLKKTRIILDR
jgi:hypothetical protein